MTKLNYLTNALFWYRKWKFPMHYDTPERINTARELFRKWLKMYKKKGR